MINIELKIDASTKAIVQFKVYDKVNVIFRFRFRLRLWYRFRLSFWFRFRLRFMLRF